MTDEKNHLGGTYLKPGMMKPNHDGTSKHVKAGISGRNGGPRIVPARKTNKGEFPPALEIPVDMDGQEFVLSMPAEKGDGRAIITAFGPPSEAWVGKALDVSESETFERIRVVPV